MPGTTSTALPSFSHDQHHETDAAKRKGGDQTKKKMFTWSTTLRALATSFCDTKADARCVCDSNTFLFFFLQYTTNFYIVLFDVTFDDRREQPRPDT